MCNTGKGTAGDKLLQVLANITGVKVTSNTDFCTNVIHRPDSIKSKIPSAGKSIKDDEKRIESLKKSKMARNTPR